MLLRGIDFGPILDAAGVRGFFGEGYSHHKLLGPFGPNFEGCTLVSKTAVLNGRIGNMPMKDDGITPKEFLPKCIMPNFRPGKMILSVRMFLKGLMLNSVGLSGPPFETLLETGRWQELTKNFFISVMCVAETVSERILEFRSLVKKLAGRVSEFKAKFGLQISISCPNLGVKIDERIYETESYLDHAAELDIPTMVKLNVLMPIPAAKQVAAHPACDALCISNTIHWDDLPKVGINRKKLFGTDISPLIKFGGGGLSGWPLLQPVAERIIQARRAGISKPINGGGGIFWPSDVDFLKCAGASSVFAGSVATLRSWRFKGIIKRAHELF